MLNKGNTMLNLQAGVVRYWNYKEKDYGIVDIPDESVQRELAAKL